MVFESDVTGRLASLEYRSAVDDYVADEVLPYVPDAWVDYGKTKVGYEIPLTRHFYGTCRLARSTEIDAEIKNLEDGDQRLLREVTDMKRSPQVMESGGSATCHRTGPLKPLDLASTSGWARWSMTAR